MKKIIFLIFALISFINIKAQTQSDSIKETYNKIHDLENRIALQDTRINKLIQQVDEVTKQNLALKKNLNLLPTIATAKAGDILEYKVIEVTGDTATNTVRMVLTAENKSGENKSIFYSSFQVIDDQGHGISNSILKDRFRMKIEGETNNLYRNLLNHPSNAPYTIDVYLDEIDPDVQYIKYFALDVADGTKKFLVEFENLPIKWNN